MRARPHSFGAFAFVLVASTLACSPSDDAEAGPERVATETPLTPDPAEIAFAPFTDERLDGNYVMLDAWHGDLGRVVELYVQAERDASGRMMWDDGHQWRLVVREGDRSARLVDDFVPNGTVRFWVVNVLDGDPVVVSQIDSGTAGVRVTEWVAAPDRDGWSARTRVDVTGNLVHRTESALFR